MSAVELAIKKVKQLSPTEAQQLLVLLNARAFSSAPKPKRTKRTLLTSASDLRAWRKSIQLTTNWEPPRMPDDVARAIAL